MDGSTRYVIVATRARDRWFDLDAVRTDPGPPGGSATPGRRKVTGARQDDGLPHITNNHPAGAPPLDWYLDTPKPSDWTPGMNVGTAKFLVGDVHERLDELIAEGVTVDLVMCSPPFLALRSYLPADHPDKAKEIGSEATPADFLDTLLALTAKWGEVLAPHGSLAIELGDTYSGQGGDNHLHERTERRPGLGGSLDAPVLPAGKRDTSSGWPLDKSLTGIPTLYAWSLAYGVNLLTGQPSPAGRWRIRNVIPWARPNPPVGALGDKFRPATSYVTVATRARDRWFDLDAVRTAGTGQPRPTVKPAVGAGIVPKKFGRAGYGTGAYTPDMAAAGAPPLDWHLDVPAGSLGNRDEMGGGLPATALPPLDWHWTDQPETWSVDDGLWVIPTQPYKGAHYATWPEGLARRLVLSMCPREVCRECGTARRRVTGETSYVRNGVECAPDAANFAGLQERRSSTGRSIAVTPTLGWTDCACANYRPGLVLDPFVGSGTTLTVAVRCGRDAIGIDLDPRNVELARARMATLPLETDHPASSHNWAADSLFGTGHEDEPDVDYTGARYRPGYQRRNADGTPQGKPSVNPKDAPRP